MPASACKNTAELIDLIKRNPGKYTYGSIGTGSLSQLAMEAIALKSRHQTRARPLPVVTAGDPGADPQ